MWTHTKFTVLIPADSAYVVMQSVKEVLQSLVDDDLVDSEKIGTSIYFWAFPSKALHSVRSTRNVWYIY